MITILILLVPLTIFPFAALIKRKKYLDAAVFAGVSAAGCALWVCIANFHPIIITIYIEHMIEMIVNSVGKFF